MKVLKSFYIGLLLVVSASCQKADENITIENTKLPMSIVARIGDAEPANARYAKGESGNDEFIKDDAIGIFMYEENNTEKGDAVKWTLGDMGWGTTTEVNWPDRENNYTFKAFYPYMEDSTYAYNKIPMPNLLGQDGTYESVASRDFLIASTTQKYGTDGTVVFQGEGKSFNHVSALIHLTIKDTLDLADATLTEISIGGGNIVASSSYSFADSSVSLTPDTQSNTLKIALSQSMNGNQDYYFILNAKNTDNENVKLTIKYTNNSKDYIAESNSFSGNVFTSGKQHDFTVAVKDNQITISGATINPWAPSGEVEDIIINNPQEI